MTAGCPRQVQDPGARDVLSQMSTTEVLPCPSVTSELYIGGRTMTGPSTYPPVYSAHKFQSVPNYSGGVIEIDLGTLPAGAYVLHVVVSASAGATATAPENRNLFCTLTTPGTNLQVSQASFPPLSANGNAFIEMPMQATLSTGDCSGPRPRVVIGWPWSGCEGSVRDCAVLRGAGG